MTTHGYRGGGRGVSVTVIALGAVSLVFALQGGSGRSVGRLSVGYHRLRGLVENSQVTKVLRSESTSKHKTFV